MPIYEYFCSNCSTKFEVRSSMSNVKTEAVCPQGHKGARKVFSVIASVSKGGEDACAMPTGQSMGGHGGCCGGGACGTGMNMN